MIFANQKINCTKSIIEITYYSFVASKWYTEFFYLTTHI